MNPHENTPVEKINDLLEKHVAMVWGERRAKNPETGAMEHPMLKYDRRSNRANTLRSELKEILQEIASKYEGNSFDGDMLIMMIREDIAQL